VSDGELDYAVPDIFKVEGHLRSTFGAPDGRGCAVHTDGFVKATSAEAQTQR
jgi:hypothetical protein